MGLPELEPCTVSTISKPIQAHATGVQGSSACCHHAGQGSGQHSNRHLYRMMQSKAWLPIIKELSACRRERPCSRQVPTCTRQRPASKAGGCVSWEDAPFEPPSRVGAAARAMDRADLGMVVEDGMTYSPWTSYLHDSIKFPCALMLDTVIPVRQVKIPAGLIIG